MAFVTSDVEEEGEKLQPIASHMSLLMSLGFTPAFDLSRLHQTRTAAQSGLACSSDRGQMSFGREM